MFGLFKSALFSDPQLGKLHRSGGRWLAPALVACAVLGWASNAFAQTGVTNPHEAQPERPTVATHAWTVAPGWIEVEGGMEFDRYPGHVYGQSSPLVAKVGLTRRTQLEVQTPIVHAHGLHAAAGDLLIGVKWRVLEGAPVVENLAVLPSVKLPTGSTSEDAGTGTTDLGVLIISSRELGPVSLDVNLGITHRLGPDDLAPHDSSVWTTAFGGPLHGPVGWTAELFGYPPTSGPAGDHSVVATLFGPTMKLRGWLVVDTGVIVPIAGDQPRALYAGAVYNIGRVVR
jgi:hypothetical protein